MSLMDQVTCPYCDGDRKITTLKALVREIMEHLEKIGMWYYSPLMNSRGAAWCPWCENWVASPDGHAPDCLGERARGLSEEKSLDSPGEQTYG